MGKKDRKSSQNGSFVVGAVALVFLIIGYQTALFVHGAAVSKIIANRDHPDTVYVYSSDLLQPHTLPISAGSSIQASAMEHKLTSTGAFSQKTRGESKVVKRKSDHHIPQAENIRSKMPPNVESFKFNPNTISKVDLQRLGFSEKQAQSIVNYREKGGKFRRKADFAKSYVVADSVYRRLESYIDIPLLDINLADSASFDSLPGIGGWFAARMIAYRKALGGYSYTEQLMDIKNFDHEKFIALEDLITIRQTTITPYPLWDLPADSLKMHPYIKNYETARSIVFFRENNPKEDWTVENLATAGILPSNEAAKLSRCAIASPSCL